MGLLHITTAILTDDRRCAAHSYDNTKEQSKTENLFLNINLVLNIVQRMTFESNFSTARMTLVSRIQHDTHSRKSRRL
jgi:hypothetical protein